MIKSKILFLLNSAIFSGGFSLIFLFVLYISSYVLVHLSGNSTEDILEWSIAGALLGFLLVFVIIVFLHLRFTKYLSGKQERYSRNFVINYRTTKELRELKEYLMKEQFEIYEGKENTFKALRGRVMTELPKGLGERSYMPPINIIVSKKQKEIEIKTLPFSPYFPTFVLHNVYYFLNEICKKLE